MTYHNSFDDRAQPHSEMKASGEGAQNPDDAIRMDRARGTSSSSPIQDAFMHLNNIIEDVVNEYAMLRDTLEPVLTPQGDTTETRAVNDTPEMASTSVSDMARHVEFVSDRLLALRIRMTQIRDRIEL